MKNEKVSVVIPNYNRGKLLEKTVFSVLQQTHSNIEIVIVDDNSTDNSKEIINNLVAKYNNIKAFYLKKNRGANYCRNLGVKESTGTIISFLDSDDSYLNHKIEKQIETLRKYWDNNVRFVTCNFNSNTNKKKDSRILKLKDVMYSNPIGGFSTLLIPKKVFMEVEGTDTSMESCQDWELYLRLLAKYNGYFMTETLINYDIQNDSITKNYDKVINGHTKVFDKINKLNKEYNIVDSAELQFRQNNLLGSINRFFGKNKKARKFYKNNFKKSKYGIVLLNYLTTFFPHTFYKIFIKFRKSS